METEYLQRFGTRICLSFPMYVKLSLWPQTEHPSDTTRVFVEINKLTRLLVRTAKLTGECPSELHLSFFLLFCVKSH